MSPIEIEITDQVDKFIAEGSSVIFVHPRKPSLMLAALDKIQDAPGHKTLGAHYQNEAERSYIRRVFSNRIDLFDLILWNNLSRPDCRPDVRGHNWMKALELFEHWVHFIDSDLDHRAYIWEERDGILKKWPLSGEELLEYAHQILEDQSKLGIFCIGFQDSDDWLSRKKWMYGAPILGGFYAVRTDMVRDWMVKHPNYDPWKDAMDANMKQVEDIAAGQYMSLDDKIESCGDIYLNGDRGNYYSYLVDEGFIKDHAACRLLTSHRYMQLYSRKLWTKQGRGELIPLNIAARGITYDKYLGNPNTRRDANVLVSSAIADDENFFQFYRGVLNAN